MMDGTARKAAELTAKLDSVDLEFAHWRADSAPGQPLEKHHTQIRRITQRLAALNDHVREALDGPGLLDGWQEIELLVLDVHQLWDFFRTKLALRYVPWLRRPLIAADELAWACYRPAQLNGAGEHNVDPAAVREPPLSFFSAIASPFAIPRGASYAGAPASGTLHRDDFVNELRRLPVPVIGVPWHQVRYLPDALVLCHEAGHHVEDDLRLTGRLEALLSNALQGAVPEPRHAAWRSWLGEIFADVYGVLAGGPAFVAALIDFLAAPPPAIAAEYRNAPAWGDYPTTHLRALICFEALRASCPPVAGIAALALDAGSMRATWQTRHPAHAMAGYEQDIAAIVGALLDGPYPELGGLRLPEVLNFHPLWEESEVDCARLLAGRPPLSGNPRALMAAGGFAFAADPAGYARMNVAERVQDRIVEVQETGTRFRGGAEGAPDPQALASYDRGAADELFDRLRRRATGRPRD
jgi:hypothetical protein